MGIPLLTIGNTYVTDSNLALIALHLSFLFYFLFYHIYLHFIIQYSWQSGGFWVKYAARKSWAFDKVYWARIDKCHLGMGILRIE